MSVPDPTPRELYLSAVEAFVELVRQVPAAAWSGPGLGEWTLRDLTGHAGRAMNTVITYLDRPAERERIDSAAQYIALARQAAGQANAGAVADRGRQAGAQLGDEPAAALTALADQVRTALAATTDDPIIETIGGGMRLSDYLPTRVFELTVHSLDIASAADLEWSPPDQVLAATLALAAEVGVLLGDGPTLLRALTGRGPIAAGYSIV
jgi:uncharacterized protein (TIGR03083 family)